MNINNRKRAFLNTPINPMIATIISTTPLITYNATFTQLSWSAANFKYTQKGTEQSPTRMAAMIVSNLQSAMGIIIAGIQSMIAQLLSTRGDERNTLPQRQVNYVIAVVLILTYLYTSMKRQIQLMRRLSKWVWWYRSRTKTAVVVCDEIYLMRADNKSTP